MKTKTEKTKNLTDDHLKTLDVLRGKLVNDFRLFIKVFWQRVTGEQYISHAHLEIIIDYLLLLDKGQINFLIINIAPRLGKTWLMRAFMAWRFAKASNARIVNVTTDEDLALKTSQVVKDFLNDELYQLLFAVRIRKNTDAKGFWETDQHGSMVSRSMQSSIIGHGANEHGLLYVDDPMKPGTGDKNTQTLVQNATHILINSTFTRKDRYDIPTVLTMQRLAFNDPTHQLIGDVKNEQWEEKFMSNGFPYYFLPPNEQGIACLKMPTVWQDRTILPETYPFEAMMLKKKITPNLFFTQYQQEPSTVVGDIFFKEWFKVIDFEDFDLKNLDKHFFVDTSDNEKKIGDSDPSGILVAVSDGKNVYILGYSEFYAAFPERIKKISSFAEQHGYDHRSVIHVEPKSSGKSIVQMLKSASEKNVREFKFSGKIKSNESKEVRAKAITGYCQGGRVILVGKSWADGFLTNLCLYPNVAHDERVDTLVMAVDHFLNKGSYGF